MYFVYHIAQNSGGEYFGEFGELNAIRQYFTQPNPFNKIFFDSVVNKK